MVNFRPIDRATPFLLPPAVEDWLPKDHLARFVVDIVDQLDLRIDILKALFHQTALYRRPSEPSTA